MALAIPILIGLIMPVLPIALAVPIRPSNAGDSDTSEEKLDFSSTDRLPTIATAKDDVLHPITTKAFCALLAQHPSDGINNIALTTPVGADDRGHPIVKLQLGTIGKALEA
jgi:hypothetical protein